MISALKNSIISITRQVIRFANFSFLFVNILIVFLPDERLLDVSDVVILKAGQGRFPGPC